MFKEKKIYIKEIVLINNYRKNVYFYDKYLVIEL